MVWITLFVGNDDSNTMGSMLGFAKSYSLSYIYSDLMHRNVLTVASRPSVSARDDDVGQELLHYLPRLTLWHSKTGSWQNCASSCRSDAIIGHEAYGATSKTGPEDVGRSPIDGKGCSASHYIRTIEPAHRRARSRSTSSVTWMASRAGNSLVW